MNSVVWSHYVTILLRLCALIKSMKLSSIFFLREHLQIKENWFVVEGREIIISSGAVIGLDGLNGFTNTSC